MFFGWQQQPQSDQLLSPLLKRGGACSTLTVSGGSKLWPLRSLWLFSFHLLFSDAFSLVTQHLPNLLSSLPICPGLPISPSPACSWTSCTCPLSAWSLLQLSPGKNWKGRCSERLGLGLERAASSKSNLLFRELLLNPISRPEGWKHTAGQFSLFYWKLSSGVLEVRKTWRCENSAQLLWLHRSVFYYYYYCY